MHEPNSVEETVPSRAAGHGAGQGEKSRSNWSGIPFRVWVFAVIVALLLFGLFGFWGLYLLRGQFAVPGPTPTAIIWTPTPSSTPAITVTATPTETVSEGETDSPTPTPSTDVSIGNYVKVSGTGGYGLSLRDGPGPDYARMDIAAEEEVFVVVEGPRTASGVPWWKVRDPENEEREWWAAGNYLEPTEHP